MELTKINIVAVIIFLSTVTMFGQENFNFSLETLDDEEIQFSEFAKEGVVLVNFWALWCKPCRIEMKVLQKLYKKFNESGFEIIGVNQDTPRSLAKVESFISSLNVSYKIGLDPNGAFFRMFNGQALPLTLLFKDGEIVYQSTGYLPGDEFKLEAEIIKALDSEK